METKKTKIRKSFLNAGKLILNVFHSPSKSYMKVIVNYLYTVSAGATLVLFFEHEGEDNINLLAAGAMIFCLVLACILAYVTEK